MLQINKLTKQFKAGFPVFSNITASFDEGKVIGIIGPNGSGKTTFLRILSVNSFPTSGSVIYNGFDVHQSPSAYLQNVGLIHDEETLPDHLTAVELLEWILRSRQMWSERSSDSIHKMFDGLELEQRNDQIGTFSTGMKKKTQIAAAFIVRPKVLIMDEPLRGLDKKTRGTVFNLIEEQKNKNNCIIFMSSHSMETDDELFDEILEFPL